jgi:ribosome maturation factor RimP
MGKMLPVPTAESDLLKLKLSELVEPIITDNGAVLVDVELSGSRSQQTLRLLVHKDSGLSLDLCAAISREVADLFDVEEPIPGRYRLEVTSPGLDRSLQTDGDFIRANGRLLKVVMLSGKNYQGRLVGWDADQLKLEGKMGVVEVERVEIAKAVIQVEF